MTFLTKNKVLFLNIFNVISFLVFFSFIWSFSLDSVSTLINFIVSFILSSTNLFLTLSICFLFIGFLKIVLIEHHKVFEIKKFSIFFCMNLMSFFFFYFIQVSKLYSSFFFSIHLLGLEIL